MILSFTEDVPVRIRTLFAFCSGNPISVSWLQVVVIPDAPSARSPDGVQAGCG